MKKVGCQDYFSHAWNVSDLVTLFFSFLVIGLYFMRSFAVLGLTKQISRTRGNQFVPIDRYRSHFRTCRLLENKKKYASLSCDAPPDKSKQLHLIHVIYENDGIVAGNVWVSTINP